MRNAQEANQKADKVPIQSFDRKFKAYVHREMLLVRLLLNSYFGTLGDINQSLGEAVCGYSNRFLYNLSVGLSNTYFLIFDLIVKWMYILLFTWEDIKSFQVALLTTKWCEFWNEHYLTFMIAALMTWNVLQNAYHQVWSQ